MGNWRKTVVKERIAFIRLASGFLTVHLRLQLKVIDLLVPQVMELQAMFRFERGVLGAVFRNLVNPIFENAGSGFIRMP